MEKFFKPQQRSPESRDGDAVNNIEIQKNNVRKSDEIEEQVRGVQKKLDPLYNKRDEAFEMSQNKGYLAKFNPIYRERVKEIDAEIEVVQREYSEKINALIEMRNKEDEQEFIERWGEKALNFFKKDLNKIKIIDNLYEIETSEDDVVSKDCILLIDSSIYNRAGMWREYEISQMFVTEKVTKEDVEKMIDSFEPRGGLYSLRSCAEKLFGELEVDTSQAIEQIKSNPLCLEVEDLGRGSLLGRYPTGKIHFFVQGSNIISQDGEFDDFKIPEGKEFETWKGKGYSGGHNSVDMSRDEDTKKIASLIKEGYKGVNKTEMGRTSGYYPEVIYWK